MRKGITPIVSIIILLLITVALAGAAFTFLQGYMFSYTGSSFRMDSGMVFCVNSSGLNIITAQVTNTGQSALAGGDFSVIQVDGINAPSALASALQPGKGGVLINAWNCQNSATGCSSGTHTVSVGTAAGVTTVNVYCP